MPSNPLLSSALMVTSLLALAGCASSTAVEGSPIDRTTASLRRAVDCDDLLAALQSDARAKVSEEVRSLREWYLNDGFYGGGWETPVRNEDLAGGDNGAPGAPTAGGEGAPDSTSTTNTQVAGVDEADIVKFGADGTRLYVVSGSALRILQSWPAADTSLLASFELEGDGMELFVEGDRVVVFSSVYALPEPLAGSGGGGSKPGGAPEPAVACDVGPGGFGGCGAASAVKVTVLSVADDTPEVEREFYYAGSYLSSRRMGSVVRVILRASFGVPASVPSFWELESAAYAGAGGDTLSRAERSALVDRYERAALAAIGETTLPEWLPASGLAEAGEEVLPLAPECGNFYLPSPGLTDFGITTLVGLDLDGGDLATTSILGSASVVYANAEALVLAQPDWSWQYAEDTTDRSLLHRFALGDDGGSAYEASGFVPGAVKDQFSIDEADGVIRIATTVQTWSNPWGGGGVAVSGPDVAEAPPEAEGGGGSAGMAGARAPAKADGVLPEFPEGSSSVVMTVALDGGTGALTVLGATPALAPGERIFSTRFVGDTAYVVTFRQVDPLFAIDLADPEQPAVLGELKIPGFSEYMHPLDGTHLLTIGRDADEDGITTGLALQIFDVSDPAAPMLAHKHVFSGDGYSEASYSHKAFTYYAERKLLAFPYVQYAPSFGSFLEVFSVDAETGFAPLGEVSHTAFVTDACEDLPAPDEGDAIAWTCEYAPDIRRGLFVTEDDTDYLYSVGWAGVLVHDLADLEAPLASVDLSAAP